MVGTIEGDTEHWLAVVSLNDALSEYYHNDLRINRAALESGFTDEQWHAISADELGGPHGEVPAGRVLFRAASRRTGLARFRASGSPVITPWRRLVSGWRRGRVGRPRGSCAVFWP